MKVFITNLVVYLLMILLMYADEFKGIDYAGNIAIFAAWFFIVCGFICLFSNPEELYKKPRRFGALSKTTQYLMIGFMVAIGWTVTGLFLLITTICLHVKYLAYKNKQELEMEKQQ